MKYRLTELRTDIDTDKSSLPDIAAKKLHIDRGEILSWEIRRKSIDSRKKPEIKLVYTMDFETDRKLSTSKYKNLSIVDDEEAGHETLRVDAGKLRGRVVVVGTGPAGLFAALELAGAGARPLVIERGPAMEERAAAVERFRNERLFDPEANMLFGEGGAGTFSDGKLATGIKDGLIRDVLSEFHRAGAAPEIMYLARPHIGTDVLRTVIVNIRKKIESLGGEFRFETKLSAVTEKEGRLRSITLTHGGSEEVIETEVLIPAIGHSARDTLRMLRAAGLSMEQKAFSIGVRIEHPQDLINRAQYGDENLARCSDAARAEREAGLLPPADYRINCRTSGGRGVYSFCMCPGGEVVVCSNEEGMLCVNGMSNSKRDSGTANSGILCDVRTEDFGGDDPLAGVSFQEKYERLAFENGGRDYIAPSCSMEDFLGRKGTAVIDSLPEFAADAIIEAVPMFARKIKGYDDKNARVSAAETRSSSPVRILRDERGESNIKGIYPAGEGAGYAGGITSAACDGIRAAQHVIDYLTSL